MTTLADILGGLASAGGAGVHTVAGSTDQDVTTIHLVADFGEVNSAPAGSLVVLERGPSNSVNTYRLDVCVRHAARRDVCGVAFFGTASTPVSLSARRLADKAGLALVAIEPTSDVSQLLATLSRHTADELHVSLRRVCEVAQAVSEFDKTIDSIDRLVAHASAVLGKAIELAPSSSADESVVEVPALLTNPDGAVLSTRRTAEEEDALVELALWRIAAELTMRHHSRLRAEEVSRRTVSELLLQMIHGTGETAAGLAPRARRLGVETDGWHVAIHLDLRELGRRDKDARAAIETSDRLVIDALDAASTEPGAWHAARDAEAVVLMWNNRGSPGPGAPMRFHKLAERIVTRIVERSPLVELYCGVGSPRAGLTGLSATASEARTAAATVRAQGTPNAVTSFDAMGLQRAVVEWFGTPSVREAIDEVLSPLAELADDKRETLTETLSVYLDRHGSVARTAEDLHLHRNAVRYRLDQALALLDVDIEDPDQRLFLHLACRARRLL